MRRARRARLSFARAREKDPTPTNTNTIGTDKNACVLSARRRRRRAAPSAAGEYKRKKVKVFVQYEGFSANAIDESRRLPPHTHNITSVSLKKKKKKKKNEGRKRRSSFPPPRSLSLSLFLSLLRERERESLSGYLFPRVWRLRRVGITLPDKWVDAPALKLKETFLKTYNARHRKTPIEASKCLLSKQDSSYLTISKDIVPDDQLIGDAFHENDEIFLVTEDDVTESHTTTTPPRTQRPHTPLRLKKRSPSPLPRSPPPSPPPSPSRSIRDGLFFSSRDDTQRERERKVRSLSRAIVRHKDARSPSTRARERERERERERGALYRLDEEVEKLKTVLADYEKEAHKNATIDALAVVDMTTVSKEIDPYKPHCLLIGMRQMYMLPVEPTYTIADIKYFIHYKGGPDNFPVGSIADNPCARNPQPCACVQSRSNLDRERETHTHAHTHTHTLRLRRRRRRRVLARDRADDAGEKRRKKKKQHMPASLFSSSKEKGKNTEREQDVAVIENFEINVLGDEVTMETLAKRVYGETCTLTEPGERKVAVPLYWGKRLQDPKYFLWIPSLHTPESFKGPGDDAPTGAPDPTQAAQEAKTTGGECSIS